MDFCAPTPNQFFQCFCCTREGSPTDMSYDTLNPAALILFQRPCSPSCPLLELLGANTIVLYDPLPLSSSFAEWLGTCGPPGAPPLTKLCWLGAIKQGGLKPHLIPPPQEERPKVPSQPNRTGATGKPLPTKPDCSDT